MRHHWKFVQNTCPYWFPLNHDATVAFIVSEYIAVVSRRYRSLRSLVLYLRDNFSVYIRTADCSVQSMVRLADSIPIFQRLDSVAASTWVPRELVRNARNAEVDPVVVSFVPLSLHPLHLPLNASRRKSGGRILSSWQIKLGRQDFLGQFLC